MAGTTEKRLASDTRLHPFELAGMGQAPFTYIGMSEKVVKVGDTVKAGGCCDYCCNGIRFECWIRSADGKEFKVGTSCVSKIYSHRNKATRERDPIYRQIQNDRRTQERKQRHKRERARIEKLWAQCFSGLLILADLPHSQKWAAEQGKTMLDEFWWYRDNCGNSGKLKHFKRFARIIAEAK